jgi:ribosomal protein L39E
MESKMSAVEGFLVLLDRKMANVVHTNKAIPEFLTIKTQTVGFSWEVRQTFGGGQGM